MRIQLLRNRACGGGVSRARRRRQSRSRSAQAPLCAPGVQLGNVVVAPLTRWRPDQKEPEVREAIAQRASRRCCQTMPCASSVKVLSRGARTPGWRSARGGEGGRRQDSAPHPVEELGPITILSFPALWSTWSDVKFTLEAVDAADGRALRSIPHHRQKGGAFEARGLEPLQARDGTGAARRDQRAARDCCGKQKARGSDPAGLVSFRLEGQAYFDIASWKFEAIFSMKPSVVSQG